MRVFEGMRTAWAGLLVGALVLSGCSSAGTTTSGSSPVAATKSTVTQTVVTDAPGDQVLALGLQVTGISMTTSAGASVSVLSAPVTIEAAHLDAVMEPLEKALSIPQGTYTSATITVANPEVTYVDPTTKKVVQVAGSLAASSTTVTFASAITVSATSSPIVFDLLVGQSVAISGTTVTVTPTWDVRQIAVGQHPSGPGDGRMDGLLGTVVSVSSAGFVLAEPNGTEVTVTTNGSTTYQGVSGLSALTAGEILFVDVAQQTDGSLLALRVGVSPIPAGSYLAGPVTATTGSPVTSFTDVVRQTLGSSVAGVAAGTSFTVAVNGSTTFLLTPQVVGLPSLPFTPSFTASTMFAGQNVGVQLTGVSGTSGTADAVVLLPQTVDGTVASVSTASGLTTYVVTLNAGSALATLTGKGSVTVYEYAETEVASSKTLAVGNTIRANGLLFNNAGTLSLVGLMRADGPGGAPPQSH